MEQPLKKYEPKKCCHGKREYRCVECGGGGICQHKRRREFCKECGGSSICEHGNRTYRCKECKGNGICEHGKLKTYCKECEGNGICEHGKYKRHCVECDGNEICEHHKRRDICIDCKGNGICEHNKLRSFCKICDGYRLCKSEWCYTSGNTKYNGYCTRCCIYLFPEIQVSRNYKTKETDVVNRITETFRDFTWVHDKKIIDGCSRRRPDLLLDVGSHIIIIEIDENKHNSYDCSCENKRVMEISIDLGHRPTVFIRFNPDEYIKDDGEIIKSCWKINKSGLLNIVKSKEKEWEHRIAVLKDQINYWIHNVTEKTIETVELFY